MTDNDSNKRLNDSLPPEYTTPSDDAGAPAPAPGQKPDEAAISDVISNMANRLSSGGPEEAQILDAMQRRFDRLAERTEEARGNIPSEPSEAFAKVEAALARLAEQSRIDAAPETSMPAASAEPSPAAAEVPTAAAFADELTPLQSAPAPEQTAWTSDSAEELTQAYEAEGFELASADRPQPTAATATKADEYVAPSPPVDAAAPPPGPAFSYAPQTELEPEPELQPAPEALSESEPVGGAAPAEIVYVGGERPAPAEAWFAERFSELATRLDAAAGAESTGSSLAPLLERLTSLETRLDTALTGKSDDAAATAGGSLHDIELCIAEIANQLETTNAEVARIAAIENQITEFTRRFTGSEESGESALFDPSSIADLVAERMASRPMALAAGDTTSYGDLEAAGIGELTAMMKDFMSERRTEGEHANAVLDTMQQTIMRLLDRMDALEGAQRAAPASNASWAQQAAAVVSGQQSQKNDGPAGEPRVDGPTLDEETPAAAFGRRNAAADNAEPETVEAAAAGDRDSLERLRKFVTELDDEPADEPGDAAPVQQRDRRPNAPHPVGAPADAAPGRPRRGPRKLLDPVAERGRFIEAARAAAAQTGQRAKEAQDDSVSDNDSKGFTLAIPGNWGLGAKPDKPPKSAGTSAGKPSTRTRLLIAALALLVVGLGATKLVTSMKLGLPGFSQSAVTKQSSPASASEKFSAEVTRPGPVAAPVASGTVYAPAPQSVPAQRLVQSAALSPDERAVTTAGASEPVSGVSRKQLPSAMVGPLSLRLAAANGEASAQFEVAARYAEGRGVQQDFEEAVKWYKRSASTGFALSQYRLGTLYERGLGVTKDIQRARIWYERAAAKGNIKAMHNLAVLAAGSTVGKPDYTKAARWFTAAAEHGLGDSQFNLAILYQHGLGVEQNNEQAYQWYALAAIAGDAEAGKRKSGVGELIGKAKAAELDRRVADWHRRPVDKVANDPHVAGQQWQRSG